MQVSILGAGWLGRSLALSLRDSGYIVKASSRNINNIRDLQEKGIQTYELNFNIEHGVIGDLDFFTTDFLIICISPGRNNSIRNDYAEAISAYTKIAKAQKVKALIFTSTSGVYGKTEGILTEESIIEPQTKSTQMVAKGESVLLESGLRVYIFRLTGLIGEGRLPGTFLAGKKEVPDPNSPVNLIKQVDIIKVFKAFLENEFPAGIYNLTSDEHPSREIYYTKQALMLGLDPPQFDFETDSPLRIVSNNKLKSLLNLDYLDLEI